MSFRSLTRGCGFFMFVAMIAGNALSAENWPSWRGPRQDGTADSGNYAVQWNAEKNVRWSIDLPGKAGSTPIVWDDKIIVTLPIDDQNGVICLDRNGKELWRTFLNTAAPGKHKKGSGANPSPVTDGERVFVYFKSGDFAALDFDGNILWQQNLQTMYGEDTLWWDLGTSPVLTSKYVVVACMHSGPSYIAAFDPATGKEVWKTDRNLDAPEEAAQSYSTPIVTSFEGQEQIVTLGADHVTCHAAETGEELWRIGGMNPDQDKYFRSIASPVVAEGIVIAPYARGNTVTAIRLGGKGDVTRSHIVWTKGLGSDVPTPTARDGKVYLCGDKGVVVCLDVKTGDEVWTTNLPKNRNAYSSSPVLAGDSLYVVREDATSFVLDIANGGTLQMENELQDDEFCISTPVLTNNEILLRTFDRLFCIEAGNLAATRSAE
ncbi:PQQ-binding-like beta-propeller repeat protein [Planctomicrobium sp. SH668]|uniref:PQQ-binding-like beta-propeller repeat protein n=1 Tax=Planctomicrobium sp. SH668 TaxID=3448126 RepID=UPI003F5BEC2A